MLKNDKLQQRFVSMITESLSEKVNSKVSLSSIDWEFPDRFVLNDLYIEDRAHDTLLFIDRSKITIDIWQLLNSHVSFRTLQLTGMDAHISKNENNEYNFQFFLDAFQKNKEDSLKIKWTMDVESVALDDCSIFYHNEPSNSRVGRFNPDYVDISSLSGILQVKYFSQDSVHLRLDDVGFKEASGFKLKKLSMTLMADKKSLKVKDFLVQLPNSMISLKEAAFLYAGPNSFKSFGKEVYMSVNVEPSLVNPIDLAAFVPAFQTLDEKLLTKGDVTGTLSALLIRNFSLKYGDMTNLRGDFYLEGLPDVEKFFVRANIQELSASPKKIVRIVQDFRQKPVKLPSFLDSIGVISYSGEISGKLTEMKTKGTILSTAGAISTNVVFNAEDLSFTHYSVVGSVSAHRFLLNRILGEKTNFGQSAFQMNINLKQTGKNQFSMDASGLIDSLEYKDYCYQNISLNGKFNQESFNGSLIMSDKNAEVNFKGNIDFNKEKPIFRFDANVRDAKLANLRLTDKYPGLTLSFNIESNFAGKSIDEVEGKFSIDNLLLANADREIHVNNISLTAITLDDTTKKLTLYSDYVSGSLTGRYMFTELIKELRSTAHHYMPSIVPSENSDTSIVNEKSKFNNFTYEFTIDNTEPIQEMIELPVTFPEESVLSGFYDGARNQFRVRLDAPRIRIKKTNLSGFIFLVENPDDYLKLMIRGTHQPENSRRNSYFLSLNSKIKNDTVNLDLFFNSSQDVTYSGSLSAGIFLRNTSEGLFADIDIKPTDVILNDVTWQIHPSTISLSPKKIIVNDFLFKHENQYLELNGSSSTSTDDSIQVRFRDLKLGNISDILNSSNFSFDGTTDGDLYVFNVLKSPFFKGRLNVYDAAVNGYTLGNLFTDVNWQEDRKALVFRSDLVSKYKNEEMRSDIQGGIFTAADSIYIEGNLKNVELKLLRRYIGSAVQNNTGVASGLVKAYGKYGHIGLEGTPLVKDFAFDVNYLKTSYVFSDTLFMTPNSFRLNQSQVFDSEGNSAVVSGLVLHEGFKNFKYAVDISSPNLLVLNTNEHDNETFYGKAYTGGNVTISGTQKAINFNINMRTRPNTRITIPLEGSSYISDADFITFTKSSENLTAADKRRMRWEKLQKIRDEKKPNMEMNLVLNLEATSDASVQLIMDPRQGDVIKGTGSGNLQLFYNSRESDFKMYGNYEIAKGEYLFTIQSIIPRKFDILEGSLVRWTGNPYQAYLDVNARYALNVSLSEILDDPQVRNALTPVYCLLNVTGTLVNPTLKFDLEFPNADEDVRRQVKSIINTEEAMNRNIASLLAIGHFYSTDRSNNNISGSAELSSVGFSTLSSAISSWISKINNDVNIGINYRPMSDGVTTSNEFDVALSTQLFNDRLLFNGNFGYRDDVTNSPNMSNSIVDFELDYKLTKSGKFSVKGFNRSNNSYFKQSPNTQGVGLIYREDFDTVGELMRSYWKPFRKWIKSDPKRPEESQIEEETIFR